MSISFRAKLQVLDGNPYVLISRARAEAIRPGWRRPMPVRVRVNGHPVAEAWRINMMPTGTGGFLLYLHGTVRRAAGVAPGDRLSVEIAFDAKYRRGPGRIPADLARGLRRHARAARTWAALPPSRRKEIARYIRHLKTPAARARKVADVLASLRR